MNDEYYMRMALRMAQQGGAQGEIPIGAVVVDPNGNVIGRAHNLTEALGDVTAHAEMQAITAAANALGGKYLTDCTLYVTVEPCVMCAGALAWSQIGRIVYGCEDPKRGYKAVIQNPRGPFHPRTLLSHGVLANECAALMQDFFKKKR